MHRNVYAFGTYEQHYNGVVGSSAGTLHQL